MKMGFLWRNDGEDLKACYSVCCLIAFITFPVRELYWLAYDGWKDVVHSRLQTHPYIYSIDYGGGKARGEPLSEALHSLTS